MTDLELPFAQSPAFERTCERLGLVVTRVSDGASTCLVQTRRLPVLGAFHLLSRGPVGGDARSMAALIRRVRSEFKGVLVVNSGLEVPRPGGLKIASGAEIATISLDQPELMRARLNQKWRNQLKKSEASGLTVTDQPLDPLRHKWFLQAEAVQQKARGYASHPAAFLLAFASANKGQARLYTAALNGQPAAGMLVLKHGRMATYQAGVILPEGRQTCAHNLLLWQIMCDLQAKRVTRLDLGRADLSPGLRRFKCGTGADVDTLGGSFLFHHWIQAGGAKVQADSMGENELANI